MAGQIMGSLDYMAPEQFEGNNIQAATDVFAFAVILFEMLTGRRLYPSESLVRAAVRRVTEPPPPLATLAPEIPSHWVGPIQKALARRPEERFGSAGEMVQALAHPSALSAVGRLTRSRTTRRVALVSCAAATSLAVFYVISRVRDWGRHYLRNP